MRYFSLTTMSLLFTAGCMKPSGTEVKTSLLTPHFTIQLSGGSVWCDVWVSRTDDPSDTPVVLESEAVASCNSTNMPQIGAYYTGYAPYVSGQKYTVNLFRRVDGSSFTSTATVY